VARGRPFFYCFRPDLSNNVKCTARKKFAGSPHRNFVLLPL
jgi:hypothetical protein